MLSLLLRDLQERIGLQVLVVSRHLRLMRGKSTPPALPPHPMVGIAGAPHPVEKTLVVDMSLEHLRPRHPCETVLIWTSGEENVRDPKKVVRRMARTLVVQLVFR